MSAWCFFKERVTPGFGGGIVNGLGMLGFRSVVRISHEFAGTPHIVHLGIKKAGQFLWCYSEMTPAFLLAGPIFFWYSDNPLIFPRVASHSISHRKCADKCWP